MKPFPFSRLAGGGSASSQALGNQPIRLLLLSFLGLIAVGTVLLRLPGSTPPEMPIGWIDAFFTATSAACVTGLVVRDTGAGFTGFGQAVILALIQLGGLGVMTFSLFVYSVLRGRISLAHRSVIEQTIAGVGGADLVSLLRLVIRFTFVTEGVGAVLLALHWWRAMPLGEALWMGIFHAVSAFCNAGFALQPDSLVAWQGDPVVNGVVMSLVVLGGLGFLVVYDLWQVARAATRPDPRRGHLSWWRRRWRAASASLSLHSKLVLAVSAALVAVGAVLFFLLENHRLLGEMPLGQKVMVSLFQSVTTRTAGFNTVEIAALSPGTLFSMILLMFVGGSPGSTAGGIKITTLAVLGLAAWSRVRGREHVNAFRRTLAPRTVRNTLSIAVGGALAVVACLFVLLMAESPDSMVREDQGVFFAYLFETVSALATVGLSTGVTSYLLPGSRILVALMMYLGRLGPLTVATALARTEPPDDWEYPEENVMVG